MDPIFNKKCLSLLVGRTTGKPLQEYLNEPNLNYPIDNFCKHQRAPIDNQRNIEKELLCHSKEQKHCLYKFKK